MANSPNPDYVPSMMKADFGTEILITNPKADKYLQSAKKSIMRGNDFRKKIAENWHIYYNGIIYAIMSQYLGSIANKRSLSNEFLGKVSRSFKDISFNFTEHPITKDLVVLKNEEAIKQSVKNLVLTKLNERLFNPDLGTDVTSYLFELNTSVAANELIEQIEQVLGLYESRIILEEINVDVDDSMHAFDIEIEYLIVGLPPEVQNLSFILVRES